MFTHISTHESAPSLGEEFATSCRKHAHELLEWAEWLCPHVKITAHIFDTNEV